MPKNSKQTTEHTIAERRAEFAKRMHIVQAWNRSYHVLEIPGDDGDPINAWPGPFHSKRAAELLLEDMIEPYVEGTLGSGFCQIGLGRGNIVADYEREAAFVELIEDHGGVNDPRGLARRLMQKQPWFNGAGNGDEEIPF